MFVIMDEIKGAPRGSRVPFRHPLATHAAMTVLGYRRNGAPIYAIAGGSGEGEGAPAGTPPAPAGEQPPAAPPAPATPPAPTAPPAKGDDGTDWKAHAREWEKRAKENNKAAEELEKLRKAAMTEQEKAVAEAETKGRTAAAAEYGAKLAAAEFRAAVSAAGVQLGDAASLIDTSQFVTDTGDVDTKAIEAAVKKLSTLAAPAAGRSGADIPGGPGGGRTRPTSLGAAVGAAIGR